MRWAEGTRKFQRLLHESLLAFTHCLQGIVNAKSRIATQWADRIQQALLEKKNAVRRQHGSWRVAAFAFSA